MKKLRFSLSSQLFPLEAVYATCYNFIDRAYIYLDKKGDNILVSLKPKIDRTDRTDRTDRIDWEGEFRNELLHNSLRMKISQHNAKIREYIVGQAICSSLPAGEAEITAQKKGYLEDPLGIAIPWEEKMKIKPGQRQKPARASRTKKTAKRRAKIKRKKK